MAKTQPLPTTQRAYTLRLSGLSPDDQSWRDALWATHEMVNRGAKIFGEWLLTLRGGLCHTLADAKISQGKGGPDREPTPKERRDRRILLALSWLSVEDKNGAPQDDSLIVAKGTDSADCRARKLCDTLGTLLRGRGVADAELGDPQRKPEDQPGTWLGDCVSSLSAAIRDDAVWVNRSAAFAALQQRHAGLDAAWAANTLFDFLGGQDEYFAMPDADATAPAEEKNFVEKAGGWLSRNWGSGKKSDRLTIAENLSRLADVDASSILGSSGRDALASLLASLGQEPSTGDAPGLFKTIKQAVGWKGRPSTGAKALERLRDATTVSADLWQHTVEKLRAEIAAQSRKNPTGQPSWMDSWRTEMEDLLGMPYRLGRDLIWEHGVTLDHALRRVSAAHMWIKRAETERRRFRDDAARIDNVPEDARVWLDAFRETRASTSGATDDYQIRRRAIDAWDKVVQQWSRPECKTVDDRIAAARQLQDDPEIEKSGDIQLFEALAADAAWCVWHPDGTSSARPLQDYVAATDAEAKRRRFKVPTYRHPDPLRHPVFTDFGESRWCIDYSAHRAPAKLGEAEKLVAKHQAALATAEEKLANATATSRGSQQAKVDEYRKKLRCAEEECEFLRDVHRVALSLWDGQAIQSLPFRWTSKRLRKDLLLDSARNTSGNDVARVSRANRLGRAVVGANESARVAISQLYDQKTWSGRLQAPRAQLNAIARRVDAHGWDQHAREMRARIKWLLTFSARLEPMGPWVGYCGQFNEDSIARPFIARNGEYAVKHRDNDHRNGRAKLLLSRLPGLRVLAVDLGHRYAAGCAVWEAMTREQMVQACLAAGHAEPTGNELYICLQQPSGTVQKSGPKRGLPVATTTVYRRVGPDVLPDGTAHPAPWARLDRQFLIKLQGEDRPARKASPDEINRVEAFERWSGWTPSTNDPPRNLAVDRLMNETVRTARLALARHGRRARIARTLTATNRVLPGNRQEDLDERGRVELLTNALAEWHALASDDRWNDEEARRVWNDRIALLPGGSTIARPVATSASDATTGVTRRQARDQLRQQLGPLAQELAKNTLLRQQLHDAWSERWRADDREWRERLRWLSRWLMPRGKRRRDAAHRHVGGLSLLRISTLTEFRRKAQVAFFTRPTPEGTRAELPLQFGQTTLDRIARLKDQRVKQLASRIVEAALGIGVEHGRRNGRDRRRPRERLSHERFASCHAVVIENLSDYRPEETRTRRENRATMDWKSAEVRKRLTDHCQLSGLHLRDVDPHYTSRQDSRTGAPGIRCVDVAVGDFLVRPWWRKSVAQARQKVQQSNGGARERYLVALDEKWSAASPDELRSAGPLRIPVRGGELFVSAHGNASDQEAPVAGGLQADLNAAANIGLRALMDPDYSGKWWYVPCDSATHTPRSDKVKGSILDDVGPLQDDESNAREPPKAMKSRGSAKQRKQDKKDGEIVNLWRDPQATAIRGAAEGESWQPTPAYWNGVEFRVIQRLRRRAGLLPD